MPRCRMFQSKTGDICFCWFDVTVLSTVAIGFDGSWSWFELVVLLSDRISRVGFL